jgi:hypothetical protein
MTVFQAPHAKPRAPLEGGRGVVCGVPYGIVRHGVLKQRPQVERDPFFHALHFIAKGGNGEILPALCLSDLADSGERERVCKVRQVGP